MLCFPILHKYQIIKELGRGGFGHVFLAHPHNSPGFLVAIKFITVNQEDLGKEHELIALKSLTHAYIVSLIDYGISNGQQYIVMNYLEEGSLADLIHPTRNTSISLDLAHTLRIMRQIGAAIDFAHAKGIYHRDIKPSNILFDSKDNAHLVDFGIAHIYQETNSELDNQPGTPQYQAPEISNDIFVPQSDLYSLGITVFEMISGLRPFNNFNDRLNSKVPNPHDINSSIPNSLWDVFGKILAVSPDERYKSAHEFTNAFEYAVANSSPILPRYTEPGNRVGSFVIDEHLSSTTYYSTFKGHASEDIELKAIISILQSESGIKLSEDRLEALKRLNNAHIVQLLDFGWFGGWYYLVTQMLEYGSLLSHLETGALQISEALRVFQQLADALDHLHSEDVVHGAIRPWNIKLDEAGNAYLCNFVIHELNENYLSEADLSYVQPGIGPSKRQDIFALAVLLYEMLVGDLPKTFPGGDLDLESLRLILSLNPNLTPGFLHVIESVLVTEDNQDNFTTPLSFADAIVTSLDSARIIWEYASKDKLFPVLDWDGNSLYISDECSQIKALPLNRRINISSIWDKEVYFNTSPIAPIDLFCVRGRLFVVSKQGIVIQMIPDRNGEIEEIYDLEGGLNEGPLLFGNRAYFVTDVEPRNGSSNRSYMELFCINFKTLSIEKICGPIFRQRERVSSKPAMLGGDYYICTHGSQSAIYRIRKGAQPKLIWTASRNIFVPLMTDWKRKQIYSVDGNGEVVILRSSGIHWNTSLDTFVRSPMHLGERHLFLSSRKGELFRIKLDPLSRLPNLRSDRFKIFSCDGNEIISICSEGDKCYILDALGRVTAIDERGDVLWEWSYKFGYKWDFMVAANPGQLYLLSASGFLLAISTQDYPSINTR